MSGNTPAPANDWSAAQETFLNCSAYAIIPGSLGPFMRDPALCAKVADQKRLLELSRLLSRDLQDFATQLKEIHEQHAGRTGPVDNQDDLILFFSVHEQYVSWTESYNAVILPVVEELSALFAAVPKEEAPASEEAAAEVTTQE